MSEAATSGWTITHTAGRRFRLMRMGKSHTSQQTRMTLCGQHFWHGWQGLMKFYAGNGKGDSDG